MRLKKGVKILNYSFRWKQIHYSQLMSVVYKVFQSAKRCCSVATCDFMSRHATLPGDPDYLALRLN